MHAVSSDMGFADGPSKF